MDSAIDSFVNVNYQSRAALLPWRQTIVRGSTFATTAGAQAYATSSDFLRLVPNSVYFGVTSSTYGWVVPEIPFEQSEYYKNSGSDSAPAVVTVTGATTGTGKVLAFYPALTGAGSVVSYDYYAGVAELTADTSAIRVLELGPVVAYDTLADVANYHDDEKSEAGYRQRAQQQFRAAFQRLI